MAPARVTKTAECIAEHSAAEWLDRLDAADVPCAPILRRGEIIHNEQVVARDIITEFDQPMVGRVRQPKPAAQFKINKAVIGGPPPPIGGDTPPGWRGLGAVHGATPRKVTGQTDSRGG